MNRPVQQSGWRRGLDRMGVGRGHARHCDDRRPLRGARIELLEERRLLSTTIDSIEDLTGLALSAPPGVPTTGDVATFQSTDANAVPSDFTATINWGDGTPTTAGAVTRDDSGVFHVAGSHTYAGDGSFTPVVTIENPDGVVDATGAFYQTNLVSSVAGNAPIQDADLINPWGLYQSTDTWASDEGSGLGAAYDLAGPKPASTTVTVPPGGPTGIVWNDDPNGFDVAPSTPAQFLFATLGGTIAGWASGASATTVAGVPGAEFTGLAAATVTTGSSILTTTPYLYADDFTGTTGAHGIDVFDPAFNNVTGPGGAFAGKFSDPNLPAGFEPFNIYTLEGNGAAVLLVAYARPSGTGSLTGAGGYIDEFDTSGNLIKTIVSDPAGDVLDGPWGMAIAPQGFGPFANDLLVGNFGGASGTAPGGTITAINPTTGSIAGTIRGANGSPLVNQGLWGLLSNWQDLPGIPYQPLNLNSLYVSAGIDGQTQGLLAQIWYAPAASVSVGNAATLTVTGELSPASDSGVSDTDDITDVVEPDFLGTTSQPDVLVSLYATAAGGTSAILIGTATSDAAGAWNIAADQALTDGAYAITASAVDPSGRLGSGAATIVPDLVIDTVGPEVASVSFQRKAGRIVVTFQDLGGPNNAGVGLDMASLGDAGNYHLAPARHPRGAKYRLAVASIAPAAGGTRTVTLKIKGKTYLRGGRLAFSVDPASPADPGGIRDIAGNAPAGAFSASLPG